MNKFMFVGSVPMFAFLVSIFSGAVYATQASTDTEVELNVSTVINISTPDTTTINCASLNTLCTANTTITVGTNNITGYTLQLNATSGYSNSLTNSATNETIPTLSQSYASGSFPTNYWGYTGGLDKSGETGGLDCFANYCPILAYQSTESNYTPNHAIKVTDAPATASNTTITFGAKADITKPSGTYTTSVTFTAVANDPPDSSAKLDTGQTVNAKMKTLAAGTDVGYLTQDNYVKSIDVHLETAAPAGFTPSEANTISSSASKNPIYIIFDNTNDAGIMHFYTEGSQIVLPSDSSYMFTRFYYLADFSDISDWDASGVTDMSYMFYYASYPVATFVPDLSDWNTSSVTDMSYMFYRAGYNATTWSVGDLSDWNTSNVASMSSMFAYAGYSAATWSVGDISDWNTSSVTNMNDTFYQAGYSATTFTLDLSGWNTSSVTSMNSMFSNAGYSATTFTLDLSGWNTSSVTSMMLMFVSAGYSATTFTLDLSGWNTSSVTNMYNMFYNTGVSATTWSVTIPPTNGNNISNTTSRLYGQTTSKSATPPSGKSFTLAQS